MTAFYSLAAPLRTDIDFSWDVPLAAGMIGYLAGHAVRECIGKDTVMTPKSSALFQVVATLALIALKKVITPKNLKGLIGDPHKSNLKFIQGAFWLVSALATYQLLKWLKWQISLASAALHVGASIPIALVFIPACTKESSYLKIY